MNVASLRITQVASALLFVTLALGLVVPKVAGFGFLALSLLALVWLTSQRAWFDGQLIALERVFVVFICVFVCVWLVAWLGHGLSPAGGDALGRMLRLGLIVPLFLFIRRVDGLDRAFWSGLIASGLVTGAFAWWFYLTGQTATFEQRVEGATNPIYFGGIALAVAVMLLPKLFEPQASTWQRGLVGASIVLAFCASLLSGSRGAWLALIPMMGLYMLTLGRRQPPRWRYGLPLIAGIGALLVLFTPTVPTSERFAEGFNELAMLSEGTLTEGALGRRWQMWQIAWTSLQGHWLTGIGPGVFAQNLQAAIDAGLASELMRPYRHPHNQYLSALTDAGLMALVALVVIIGVAARRFYRLFFSGLNSTRQLGWAGLAAVTLLAVMALSESIFERNAGVVWFGLLTASAMGLVHARRRHELTAPTHGNKQSLSVIMITCNEADRIEASLRPLTGWADEIIVLDSGSTDDTVARARRYTSQVFETDWPGFGRQKQRALDKAQSQWVLSLDADEVISDELKAEIDLVLGHINTPGAADHTGFDGYTLPWLTHAFGATLRHGRWSRTPLRLVRRDAARFTDAVVHERLELANPSSVGHLEAPLHHYSYRNLEHAKTKLDHYARLQFQRRSTPGAWPVAMTRAGFHLMDNLVFRAAILDGRAGVILSGLLARYTYQKYTGAGLAKGSGQ